MADKLVAGGAMRPIRARRASFVGAHRSMRKTRTAGHGA